MTRPRSARAVTSLIHRLQNPVPGREYEHRTRLLAHARAHGHVTPAAGAALIGHRTPKTAARLLGDLVDEGLLARSATAHGHYVPVREEVTRWSMRTPLGARLA